MWLEAIFDIHLGKYLNEVISKLLTCFLACFVLLAYLLKITEDMLNGAATGSSSLFLKILKLSSKER